MSTPTTVDIGDRVKTMTFRKLFTADGIHDYFWKAEPVQAGEGDRRDSSRSGRPRWRISIVTVISGDGDFGMTEISESR